MRSRNTSLYTFCIASADKSLMSFFKKILKGAAAFATAGGPQGVLALAIKKGIQKRKAKKEKASIDPVGNTTAQFISGESAYLHQEIKAKKEKQRKTLFKIKEAQKLVNQGQSVKAAMSKVNLTEAEYNEPIKFYL